MIFLDGIACAGEISWRRQEGDGRSCTTDEPGVYPPAALCADRADEPTTRKILALRGCVLAGARGVAALDRIADTLFARLLADRARQNATQAAST